MLPGRVQISLRVGEALDFFRDLRYVEFRFTYVEFVVEKGHLILTGIRKYRTKVLHRTQEHFQESWCGLYSL